MSDSTVLFKAAAAGDRQAAAQLLPLVYDERRRLAARKLAGEKPGQSLQTTDLVHEAYIRLVGKTDDPKWQGRAHFCLDPRANFGVAPQGHRGTPTRAGRIARQPRLSNATDLPARSRRSEPTDPTKRSSGCEWLYCSR